MDRDVLNLRIKKTSLLAIAHGFKKEEFRDYCDYYFERLQFINKSGDPEFYNFKILHLYCGNIKDGLFCDVEIKEMNVDKFVNPYFKEYKKFGTFDKFEPGELTYTIGLGKIIKTNVELHK